MAEAHAELLRRGARLHVERAHKQLALVGPLAALLPVLSLLLLQLVQEDFTLLACIFELRALRAQLQRNVLASVMDTCCQSASHHGSTVTRMCV